MVPDRLAPRHLALVVVVWTLAAAGTAAAHVGGHDLVSGATLPVWTDPGTGQPVSASLSFVRAGLVYVEDQSGRRLVWALNALVPADRARVTAFLMRLDRVSPRPAPARPVEPRPTAREWLGLALAATCLAATARRGWTAGVRMVAPVSLLLVALACGAGEPAAPALSTPTAASPVPTPAPAPSLAPYFAAFPQHVRTREDAAYAYVESDGLADHVMMTGIRSWQQQVPLPADYTGSNAWRIPLAPRLAAQPVSARTGLFRGAIALAVNGVPIFNALNNRGDDAFLAGELDDFGGHAGRADDYHYHTAPLFLSTTVGATRPIGVALDGFLLYGAVEPDGSPMRALDEYNGHADTALGYHYHGTRTYPYINGGMKGEVQVSDQVEPQPSVRPVRPALTPLQGATITRHAATGPASWTLEYQIAGRTSRVDYRIEGTRVTFVFTDPNGATRTEVYTR
jgi:hypothetical protein